MARERSNDPYASGQDRAGGSAGGSINYLRYIVVGVALILIVLGISLGMSVFSLIHGIIEGPDTLTAHLDAWAGPSARAEQTPAQENASGPTEETPPAEEAAGAADVPVAAPAEPTVAADAQSTPPQPRGRSDQGAGQTRERTGRAAVPKRSADMGFISEVLDLIREGGMARATGAFFILLFTMVLVRIPFLFLRMGISLLTSTANPKAK